MRNIDIRVMSKQLGFGTESLESWLAKEGQQEPEKQPAYRLENLRPCYENRPSDEFVSLSV
ncbi:hypothetical protein ACI48J_08840 [Paenibacillus chitinolyticus]|uniref:hypothetical protein n=1 Tax=Paenibacillus chitinolyticus TaxID=79263 RepID=UPI002DB6B5D9|nr:hypothetical protein [Paenibacillus chitinolyticus]MEC0246678.1 hypothetical protein [Paenibacillus chitinolyticus]